MKVSCFCLLELVFSSFLRKRHIYFLKKPKLCFPFSLFSAFLTETYCKEEVDFDQTRQKIDTKNALSIVGTNVKVFFYPKGAFSSAT
jgi:hypothetical protein